MIIIHNNHNNNHNNHDHNHNHNHNNHNISGVGRVSEQLLTPGEGVGTARRVNSAGVGYCWNTAGVAQLLQVRSEFNNLS